MFAQSPTNSSSPLAFLDSNTSRSNSSISGSSSSEAEVQEIVQQVEPFILSVYLKEKENFRPLSDIEEDQVRRHQAQAKKARRSRKAQ
jgi:hypothetical protein